MMFITLLIVASLLSLMTISSAKCKEFQPQYFGDNTVDYAFTATQRSFIASPVVNCSTAPGQTTPGVFAGNETMRCARNQCYLSVPANYRIRLNRTLTIAVDTATEQDIFDLVEQYFGAALSSTDLNSTQIWPVTQAATCVNESMAAYWIYSPVYSCVQGNLTDCDQGTGPADGTFIRACGIRFYPSNRILGGELSIVQANGVESRPAPPNATENASMRIAGGRTYADLGAVALIVGLMTCWNLGV